MLDLKKASLAMMLGLRPNINRQTLLVSITFDTKMYSQNGKFDIAFDGGSTILFVQSNQIAARFIFLD
jgi:hypothetical protein